MRWMLITRKRLRERGYVLVSTDRIERILDLEDALRRTRNGNSVLQSEIWPLRDRISELEAELEGQKRVNEALAARVVAAEMERPL